jgi:hypothetical protein
MSNENEVVDVATPPPMVEEPVIETPQETTQAPEPTPEPEQSAPATVEPIAPKKPGTN